MAEEKPLLPADLLTEAKAGEILANLKNYFKDKPLNVSDVRDDMGHQYVDLVQEGGGVLGIALVGYTYILEKMGIRFFSLAGTSAGSINAMMLACCGNKEDEKTDSIIDHFLRLKLFSIVDGKKSNWGFTKFIKKNIQRFLLRKKFFKKILLTVAVFVVVFVLCVLTTIVMAFTDPGIARWSGLAAGGLLLFFIIAFLYFRKKFSQFSSHGYGLNEGNFFHQWIKDVIASNHIENDPLKNTISNLADFSTHFMRIPKLTVTPDSRRINNDPPYMPILTIIACDIVAERKIEFPAMWDLYWRKQEDVNPGDFVRASMSIPVFFETYTLTDIDKKSSFKIWQEQLNWQNADQQIPVNGQFIDGGTLSNFPINVFYNPHYPVPRMPTFGIRLQDGVLDNKNAANKTFAGFLASMFNTIRLNFDRDFITRNRSYNKGVKFVDVRKHSWLNFFMEDKEKIELFKKGALAAAEFLKTFNWEEYKAERLKNFEMGQERFANPNNLSVFPNSKVA